MDRPVFTQRGARQREYQVRFHADSKELYEIFVARAESDGLVIKDVFNEFMRWFAKRQPESKPAERDGGVT